MTTPELSRKVRQLDNDVHQIYTMLSRIEITHGNRLNEIGEDLDGINARLDGHDARFDAIDTRFDAVDARFNAVDARFDVLESKLDRVIDLVTGDRPQG